jgi:hypothetical protein
LKDFVAFKYSREVEAFVYSSKLRTPELEKKHSKSENPYLGYFRHFEN